jgi:DNA-binding transcriptional LysR family regulator
MKHDALLEGRRTKAPGVMLAPFRGKQSSIVRTALEREDILSGQFWGELRVFLAVAKGKSFNRAAEILNTSQPTVSRQVKRLQDLIGSQLFIPTQNGVKLTPKGQELATALSGLDHALFALTNDLRAEKQDAEGVVRVSIMDGLNIVFVAPALEKFASRFPKIQCHLKSPTNVISLREGQIDLMIGFVPTDAADITAKRLGSLHFIPVASRQYTRKHGLPTRKNLARHCFVQSEMYAAKSGLWNNWNRIVASGRIAHYCDNSLAYGMMVKAGIGIGLVGSYATIEPDALPLELIPPVSLPLYALALTERLKSRPVRAAFDWLCNVFGSGNPWFNEEFKLNNPPSEYDAGFKLLFNL